MTAISGLPVEPAFIHTLAFEPLTDIGTQPPKRLAELISTNPTLKIYSRSSPYFKDLKAVWNLEYGPNEPLALIRATNTLEVSTIVRFCVNNDIPLTVRSGGHDLWGRSLIADAVILDIRELNQITLSEDNKSVTIGGGTTTSELVKFLDSHGLVTSCAVAGVVGHLGWAFSGGFGPLVNAFGMGVDQIISAKVVTADGNLRNADHELLWGIKGAGGAFGVITEVAFKVYPLPNMLGGMMVFKFDEAEKVFADLQTMLDTENVPSTLTTGCKIMNKGRTPVFLILFSWASPDIEEGRKWLDKIKGLGTVLMDMVSETTMKKWSDAIAPMLPAPHFNSSHSFFLSSLTSQAVKILLSAISKIPEDVEWGTSGFLVRGTSTESVHKADSSFVLRENFVFLHSLAPVKEKERLSEAKDWTEEIFNKMKEEGLVKANYLAITGPELKVEECFSADAFERLKALKKKVDPGNVFRHVPAQLF